MPFDMKSLTLDAAAATSSTVLFGAIGGQTDSAPTPIPITILTTYFSSQLGLSVGTSAITSGTTGRLLYDNSAILGEALLTYSAAQLQLGAADAASPVAQTLRVQSVVAGTSNTSGVNWTLNGSLSTGSGTSGDIIFQTGGTGAGAAVQNTATTALTLKGATQQVLLNVPYMVGTPALSMTGQSSTGIGWSGNGLFFSNSGTSVAALASSNFIMSSTGQVGFSSGAADTLPLDTILARGAAGVFKFSSANSFSANSNVATVLGSVGPSGAQTTVQKWLTIVDSGGATRYIPCF